MKKTICLLLAAVILLSVSAACAVNDTASLTTINDTTANETTAPINEPHEPSETAETDGDWITNADLPYNKTGGEKVYFTDNISAEGLVAIYHALGAELSGNVAVKLSTGEPPSSNYLAPELIKDLVQEVNGVIVECNTAYGGRRGNTEYHLQVAKDHGFADIAEIDILDTEGEITLPVTGGEILTENYVGSHFVNYDYYVVLSHFKGHEMAGYGGAIKNISIGIASSAGKVWIHSGGTKKTGSIAGNRDNFLKSMAEAGKSIADYLDGQILYINVMNNLSIDCDCNGYPKAPDMHDIGILASFDPVALDQACLDLVYAAPDTGMLPNRINALNGILTVEHAENIGLGNRTYELVFLSK